MNQLKVKLKYRLLICQKGKLFFLNINFNFVNLILFLLSSNKRMKKMAIKSAKNAIQLYTTEKRKLEID